MIKIKPYVHARLSANRYGGEIDDYIKVHEFLDSSKAFVPDMTHRTLLHNAWGCYLAQDKFGIYLPNSVGKDFVVRDICEEHILEDLGFIPTVEKCLETLNEENATWLWGKPSSIRKISLVD